MRTYEDALRSVRRYVFSAMGGKPWRTRTEMDARFKRPFALVDAPTPSPMSQAGPSSMRQALPITVQLYPPPPTAGENRNTEARMLAARAGELLTQALTIGVADIEDPTVRGYFHRIPLWDYTDDLGNPLPFDGRASVATKREHCDYLLVDDGWSVHTRPEASEQQLFVAVATLRVQWYRSTLLKATGVPLASATIQL